MLDPISGRLVGDVPVGMRPVAIAVGAGGVWVANADDGTVSRIDPNTHKVVHVIGVGADVSDVAVGFGSVWVADGNDGTITRIDPTADAIQATLPLNTGAVNQLSPDPVYLIAVGRRYLWATRGDRLLRIDPATNQQASVVVGTPIGLASGGGAVWVTTLAEKLLRIQSNTVSVSVWTPLPKQALAPVFTGRYLWLIANLGRGEVTRVNPESLAPVATALPGGSPSDLAAGNGAIWVSNDDGSVSKIDARTATVTKTTRLGNDPTALAVGYRAVWVAVKAANG